MAEAADCNRLDSHHLNSYPMPVLGRWEWLIRCPKCHAENRDDSKFCSNCGAPLGSGSGAGAGADQEEASFTKTLETPVRVLRPGTVIAAKYRIVEEIGAGGKLLLDASAS